MPPNVGHQLRGGDGDRAQRRLRLTASAACPGYTACHRSLPKLPISDTRTLTLRAPASKGSRTSGGNWLGACDAASGIRERLTARKARHVYQTCCAPCDRTEVPAQKAPAIGCCDSDLMSSEWLATAMPQHLSRARSYSWIGAVADCAMRKAFGAASERGEADRRSRAPAEMGPLRFKPYNYK